MSRPIIEVDSLSKRYRLGVVGATTLRDDITRFWRRPQRESEQSESQEFWALREVSFTVNTGDIVGILGANGAGKSTLLKVLSRITEPTAGRVTLRGRVASLLEVGTGFHPDLSGRENIYLNGAILGMKRAEIRAKFDEIVAFAEVEKFIDTPVKRYSSGMYVRLAFAVAAHLEPEILIVDEVLAVGDAAFQKKCLGRMEDVASHGRTVLFVSHDMTSVSKLCRQGLVLQHGRVAFQGEMRAAVAQYLGQRTTMSGFADLRGHVNRLGAGNARFETLELLQGGKRSSSFAFGEAFTLRISTVVEKAVGDAYVAILITTTDGVAVHGLENTHAHHRWIADVGRHEFEVTIERLQLYPGAYSVDLWLGDILNHRIDYVREVATFEVVQTPESGLERPLFRSNGLVFTPTDWKHRRVD